MLIETKGLGKKFDDHRWGLRNVNISLTSGEFILLTGHNGSGKSLLIRHIFGLESPDEGQVFLNGIPANKNFTEIRRKTALVFQEPEHQILGLTVKEDLEFTPKQRKVPGEELKVLTERALDQVGLKGFESHLSSFLSGGEKRRLAIASALMSKPEILVLDEPFNGLDWPGVKILLTILKNLHSQGLGILVVTHDLEKCLALADRLVVLEGGEKILDGTPSELWDRLPDFGLRRLVGSRDRLKEMIW